MPLQEDMQNSTDKCHEYSKVPIKREKISPSEDKETEKSEKGSIFRKKTRIFAFIKLPILLLL